MLSELPEVRRLLPEAAGLYAEGLHAMCGALLCQADTLCNGTEGLFAGLLLPQTAATVL